MDPTPHLNFFQIDGGMDAEARVRFGIGCRLSRAPLAAMEIDREAALPLTADDALPQNR